MRCRKVLLPELALHVGEGVDAEAVDAGFFDPPDHVLGEVLRDGGVPLVHVRQQVDEPAVERVERGLGGGVWVGDGAEDVLVVRVAGGRAVEPVGHGRVRDPGVGLADVVGDVVEDELHAAAVELGGEMAVGSESAEAGLDRVHIGGAVAVVVAGPGVVLQDGREPDGGDAELLEVVEVIDDALEVAAVIRVGVVRSKAGEPAGALFDEALDALAVGEAVGHDEVEDVGGGEAGGADAVRRGERVGSVGVGAVAGGA